MNWMFSFPKSGTGAGSSGLSEQAARNNIIVIRIEETLFIEITKV
jgi:hypothetical protein